MNDSTNDEGFGLVEIVIAMFLLAALSLAILPLLIQGVQQSAVNATLATATQAVNGEIERAQAAGPTGCAAVRAREATNTVADARGVQITVVTSVGACPAGDKGTVRVESVSTRADSGAALARSSTLVLVTAP